MNRIFESLHYFGLLVSGLLVWLSFSMEPRADRAIEGLRLSGESMALTRESALLQESVALLHLGLLVNEPKLREAATQLLRDQSKRLGAAGLPEALLAEASALLTEAIALGSGAPDALVRKGRVIDFSGRASQVGRGLASAARERSLLFQDIYVDDLGSLRTLSQVVVALSFLVSLFLYNLFLGRKRQAEQQLRRSEKLHSLLFSSLKEGVLYCRADGQILSCNQSAGQILGQGARGLVGKKISEIFPTLYRENGVPYENGDRVIAALVESGQAVSQFLIGFLSPTLGQRWLSLNSQPVVEAAGASPFSTLLSFADVSDQVETRVQLDKQRGHAVESARLRDIGEMASEVVHEINNPMAVIRSSVELIDFKIKRQGDAIDVGFVKGMVERVLGMVTRVSKITSSVLTYARDGRNDPFDEFSVRTLVEQSVLLCNPRLRKSRAEAVIGEISPDLFIQAREVQLSQVISNLVTNAADAVAENEGGKIWIDVTEEADTVTLHVKDNGPGIPKANQTRIFMPFFTTKAVGKGTGLGLSVTKGVVEAHGGTISLESCPGETHFAIRLPKRQDTRTGKPGSGGLNQP
ncbi:MAG: PAS domain-containing protein [Bdellovibrionales bacterium]|nr:PAS domain-containing protein [Bdellovibrionales bacterium]